MSGKDDCHLENYKTLKDLSECKRQCCKNLICDMPSDILSVLY